MKSLLLIILPCTLFTCSFSFAQKVETTSTGIKTTVNGVNVELQMFGPLIVRVLKSPEGTVFAKKSLSVIKQPGDTKPVLTQKGNVATIKSKALAASIDLQTGVVVFSNASGTVMLQEKHGAQFTPFDDNGEKTFSVKQSFGLDETEAIYGLGQHQNGRMNQRNVQYHLVQNNLDDVVPFFQSNKGYGIFWDNYSPTTFTDNQTETSFDSQVGDCIDYYFMIGGNADGVISQMRELTGHAPMFPLWTFGYWQSKERYKTQEEVVDVVKKYREINVPLDGIIQDWQYWGPNYLWNAMDFLNPDYKEPKKMITAVHDMNAHMIISIWSSFGPHTKQYKELNEKNMLMNFKTWPMSGIDTWPPNMDYPSGVRVYDPYNPEARDIYWKHLNKNIFSIGMDGWWMDSTEPDHMDEQDSDLNNKTYLGSFRKVRNAFPLMTVGGVYDHQRSVTSGKRVFILTRSAFAGQQRYGANTWSGDTRASWEVFKNQIAAGVNFSLSGIPYWNCDLGGFFLNNFPNKINDPEYKELYVRWVQFGCFTPMMRSHGTDAPREIYQFGKKGDAVFDAINQAINLRYSLLPYIYSTSWDVTKNNASMMRGLVMDFPNDRNALDIADEYMFGRSLLVSPVTSSMYVEHNGTAGSTTKQADFTNIKQKNVYLPGSTQWYDFWTGEKLNGGQTLQKSAPLNTIPVYVKAGSIVPLGPKVQYATEKKWDTLEVRIYPGNDGNFTLYEDEGDSYNYEKGSYSEIAFNWNDKSRSLKIEDRKGNFPGMVESRVFNIVLVTTKQGIGDERFEKSAKKIVYDGRKQTIKL